MAINDELKKHTLRFTHSANLCAKNIMHDLKFTLFFAHCVKICVNNLR